MKAIEIKQENVTEAFKSADGCEVAINILTNLFGKQKPDYTDFHNIKTYEDAFRLVKEKSQKQEENEEVQN